MNTATYLIPITFITSDHIIKHSTLETVPSLTLLGGMAHFDTDVREVQIGNRSWTLYRRQIILAGNIIPVWSVDVVVQPECPDTLALIAAIIDYNEFVIKCEQERVMFNYKYIRRAMGSTQSLAHLNGNLTVTFGTGGYSFEHRARDGKTYDDSFWHYAINDTLEDLMVRDMNASQLIASTQPH